jgi:drug/metabolite transporter (DMT)-like permease
MDRRGPRPLVPLTRSVMQSVGPLAAFNIAGHVFSSVAIGRVPVSLVHTIKAVSPFFTVLLSTAILRTHHPRDVYMALVPLVVGVVLACSTELSWELWGGLAALASALVFVVQNIVSKKVTQAVPCAVTASGHAGVCVYLCLSVHPSLSLSLALCLVRHVRRGRG